MTSRHTSDIGRRALVKLEGIDHGYVLTLELVRYAVFEYANGSKGL